ncbi:MAG: PqqD family protein [Acidimicrobiia bacterium]
MSDNGAAARFRLAGPEIISETFDDGESVVVNLENGFYFSLNPVGGLVFDLLGSGVSRAAAEQVVGARYEAAPGTICAAVADFATHLVEEGLLAVGAPADGSSAEDVAAQVRTGAADGRVPFENPTLTVYTDMQDLLLADPIHDYDETGWPARIDER